MNNCKHEFLIHIQPTYSNDFVYNPGSFLCPDCGKWWKFKPGEHDTPPEGSKILGVISTDEDRFYETN